MTTADVVLVAIITGLVQAAKGMGYPKKYAPALAVTLGILAGVFVVHPGNIVEGIVVGLAMGLGAVGLYSGTKNVKEGVKNRD